MRLIAGLLVGPITWHVFRRLVPRGAPLTRRQRDLIRRQVRLLLTVLGDTPEAIRAALHRLHSFGDFSPAPEWHAPLEQYLYVRTGHAFDIRGSLITVGDTFAAATPNNIRRYLASASYTIDL